ncbi:glycosyltransferase [Gordonia sp. OPL2]|uniref:glycosyltransferase n=1 Tax=Gordonia sp. OPL2 TaxID=2486274 RepID=UPI0021CCB120|nr:glycosyltransferase [Gordonia sp. OPL2]
MMRLVMACNGSRGDVQPAVALGGELASRGHTITMLVPSDLVGFSAATGLPTEPYGGSTREVLDSDLVRERMKSRDPRTRLRAVTELTVRDGRLMQQQLLDATEGADAIIAGSAGQERAHNVAEVRRVPHVPLHLCPLRRNGSTSLLTHLGLDVPAPVARASWSVAERILWWASRSAENALRDDLGLDTVRAPFAAQIAATGVPEIQAYDAALFPALTDEWGLARPLVGFFTLAPEHREGVGDRSITDVLPWIESGPAPVYVGFGSMIPADADRLAEVFCTAADELDIRLLVSGGWSDFMSGVTDDRIRVVGHVDHDTILPLCAAAVHHGGAGTVAAGLRAGIPTVVTWVGADQPIWGAAIARAGVGTSLPMSRVDRTRLVDALGSVAAEQTRERARALSNDLVEPKRAVTAAAEVVERAVSRRR